MVVDTRPLADITQEALQVLFKTLGVVNTIRFLNQFTDGYGNYTEEREMLFGEMSVSDIVAEIKKDQGYSDEDLNTPH